MPIVCLPVLVKSVKKLAAFKASGRVSIIEASSIESKSACTEDRACCGSRTGLESRLACRRISGPFSSFSRIDRVSARGALRDRHLSGG